MTKEPESEQAGSAPAPRNARASNLDPANAGASDAASGQAEPTSAATGLALHVERYGDVGPSVVLAHGFGGSARNFRPQVRALRERYRVALYDARGHARSPAPASAEAATLTELARDLELVAEGTEPPANIVGGLSLGAMTALTYALRRPERVSKLILAALPPGSSDTLDALGRNKRQWALDFAACIEAEGLVAAGERFVWGTTSRFDPQGAALIRQGFLEHDPGGLVQVLRSALAALPSLQSLAQALRAFRAPTLVIVGAEDRECLRSSEEVAALLPAATLVVVPGAGHVVNLAKPDAFNRSLLDFLA